MAATTPGAPDRSTQPLPPSPRGTLGGAAFLMAVSAIGPGFLTQTTQFTAQLGASLAFAILLSTLIDIGAQLNTWRVVCVSGRRGQEVINAVVPGLGWMVLAVLLAGSFVFNLGNLGGCALALEALTGLPPWLGVSLSAAAAIALFVQPRMLTGLDWTSRLLGAGMILMTLGVTVVTAPPVADAVRQAVLPDRVDFSAVVTLVGGTVGGYIMFSGAHRLLDGGVRGPEQVGRATTAAVQGILIAGIMRVTLFLAILGVLQQGAVLDPDRPVFSAFHAGAGRAGYILSCLVFWSAAITSVIGCSYTSISFLVPAEARLVRSRLIAGFIAAAWLATLALHAAGWKPTPLLIVAGTVNGVLLPAVLGVVLVAAHRRGVVGDYQHPLWAVVLGWLAWLATVYLAYRTLDVILSR